MGQSRAGSAKSARGATAKFNLPFQNAPRLYTLSQKPTGPRWSMPGRSPGDKPSTNPGPGAYSPEKGQYNPKFSMLPRRDLADLHSKDMPGPGAYNADGKLRKQIPVSLGARNFPKDDFRETPGPGAYTPVDPTHVAPKYSLLGRPNDRAGDYTPGPLDYSPRQIHTSRATSLHPKLAHHPNSAASNPGPGSYSLGKERVSDKMNPVSFSIRGRVDYNPASGVTPGPGTYNPDNRKQRGFSMTPRRADLDHGGMTPGPGAYSPKRPTTTAYSIRGKIEYDPQSLQTPGPAAYNPKDTFYSVKQGIPAFTMTGRAKLPEGGVKNAPGPGHYDPSINFYSTKASSPRHTMHGKLNYPSASTNTPGAGQYNVIRPNTAPAPTLKSRVPMGKEFVTPHATAYDPKMTGRKGPSFTLRGRVSYQPKSLETPG
eukprot:CAMPEP_0173385460 /NCGR_PEP_ID=MMETSP1356-20130122/8064_1 /TAXON_ID=77927 ORGANISM="Hemiselmis virescens, Strain PCC157" /NCGR_SAMPLE_ID=MMETSP1356 /ASSEMBLY_ACC=CAM_ASM_000847 /LENGTH=426 /DNA_ID=CAMNT_0014341269 /DNA_START=238 /DNA_END=1515 /DNA_ORIENTATION=-